MNVAIFSPNKNPYSETFIQAHKQFLKGNIFYYYGSPKNIKLEHHSSLVSNFKRNSLKFYSKVTNKPSSFVNNSKVLLSLIKNKIDVILVEYGTHAFHLYQILKASKLPVVVHFHGYDASRIDVVKKCDNYKKVFELSFKIVAVSKKMEQMLLDIDCPREKLINNTYGPRPEFENVNPDLSKPQFVSVGRFADKKAPYYTILAFKKVVSKFPEAKLLMAGDGFLLNACENLIKQFNLENNVKLLGVINSEKFVEILQESRAFVQHSIIATDGDMEGTPLSILEAGMAGVPVISTYHAGIPDVIIHQKTGLLCNEHDVESMAQNMCQLLDDIEYAKTLGRNGKEFIKNNFSLDRHIHVLNEVLTDAVQSSI